MEYSNLTKHSLMTLNVILFIEKNGGALGPDPGIALIFTVGF